HVVRDRAVAAAAADGDRQSVRIGGFVLQVLRARGTAGAAATADRLGEDAVSLIAAGIDPARLEDINHAGLAAAAAGTADRDRHLVAGVLETVRGLAAAAARAADRLREDAARAVAGRAHLGRAGDRN